MTRRAILRASDADREQVAERLRTAAAEGRLLAEELEDRLGAALSAKTYGELDAVVADLPAPEAALTRRSRAPIQPRLALAMALALSLMTVLIAAVAAAIGGHAHPDHELAVGLRGGAPVIWLVWIAVAWRLLARRRRGAR